MKVFLSIYEKYRNRCFYRKFTHPRTNHIMTLLRLISIFLSILTIVFIKKYSNHQSKCQHAIKETRKFKVVSNSRKYTLCELLTPKTM